MQVFLAMAAGGDEGLRYAVKMLRNGASSDDRKEFLFEAETMLALGGSLVAWAAKRDTLRCLDVEWVAQ